ncbi:PLP-dependent transferase [Punctularia strigosozonata HHB-11173 SS5]|uniref:PLP-dependent transferase n=1 Tax=Punctularia strigosozonata (strain HHB-11173) TaxID=741275 RepID=R7S3X8_PUNST|nr:PLP-dependent transferase [Punctularia strigosozonata HHB-11173 SS5]EIN04913.1 PLP-dependent transferase [Punctularia strigosozonata HHB-11173 SS5]
MTALDFDSKGCTYNPQSKPPSFGHDMLKYFSFRDGYVNLNHGSYGSLPRPVQTACEDMAQQIEACPDKFMRLTYQSLLIDSRSRVARLLGAHTDECVLVPNATHGINTVLRNIQWNDGDILIGASTTYVNVNHTLQYLHDVHPTTTLAPFHIRFPTSHSAIVESFREHLRIVKATLPGLQKSSASVAPKMVAVIDSIVSNPGVRLPWQEMVSLCREEGVWSVVDAAHSIGQEPDINLSESRPDFFVTNCHKWLFAKRGCACLYVPFRNQHITRSSIPTGNAYQTSPPNFVKQHEWTGTVDWVPYLSIKAALEFRQWIGGEAAILEYCHKLALKGGRRLAEIMGTELMDQTPDSELTLSMVNVRLPFPDELLSLGDMNAKLLDEYNTFAGVFRHDGKWWTRCSAQVWNEISDFEYLGKVFNTIAKELSSIHT